jgi:hypothetical protein
MLRQRRAEAGEGGDQSSRAGSGSVGNDRRRTRPEGCVIMDQLNGIIAIITMGYDRNLMLCDSGRGACIARCRECQAIETDLLRLSRVVLMIVRWRVVMRVGRVVVMAMLMLVLVVPVRMGIAVMEMRDNMLMRMGMAVVMGGAVDMMMAEGEREFEHQRQ